VHMRSTISGVLKSLKARLARIIRRAHGVSGGKASSLAPCPDLLSATAILCQVASAGGRLHESRICLARPWRKGILIRRLARAGIIDCGRCGRKWVELLREVDSVDLGMLCAAIGTWVDKRPVSHHRALRKRPLALALDERIRARFQAEVQSISVGECSDCLSEKEAPKEAIGSD